MSDIRLSVKAKRLKLGICRHYKNKDYEVLEVAIHSETLEELVLYKALYGDRLTWIRPFDMFIEKTTINGETRPRFEYVGKI